MKAVFWLIFALTIVAGSFTSTAQADTLAVAPNEQCPDPICHAFGAARGAVGFSFTPTTNMAVMQIGYSAYANSNPIVSFFAETNLLASYSLGPNPGITNLSSLVIYTNIPPLCLSSGQRYSILLQDGDLSNSFLAIQGWVNREVSAEISNYTGQILQQDGTWTNTGSGGFVMGADFYYVVPPCNLSVAIVSTNVWLTLSTHSNELYDVQRREDVVSGSWRDIATNLSGTCDILRHIDVGTASTTSQFYRVRTHF